MIRLGKAQVIGLILGGGRGTRLYPLTKSRSKPAVPIAGKYRLIDIPISNCIHSGINQIFVLTQFNSTSLHNHIVNSYKFDMFGGGFVEILAAQQTQEHDSWYQGTADAVRRNLAYFNRPDIDLVLILSGDQLYRMDFAEMAALHNETRADVTIATLPVDEETAKSCGIMRIDETGLVTRFQEKPKTPEALAAVHTEPASIEKFGVRAAGKPYLASMGIYLFNRQVLVDLLKAGNQDDFGKGVFPMMLDGKHRVQTFLFEGYWEDIGTVGAFHQANIDLTRPDPPFEFTYENRHIFTRPRFLPCSKLSNVKVVDSLVADGCLIGSGSVIENSVIGIRARIGPNSVVRNSYIMGADGFESDQSRAASERAGRPAVGIGAESHVENAIVDKNARIGKRVRIVNAKGVVDDEVDQDYGLVRDSIVVVPKFTIIPDGRVV